MKTKAVSGIMLTLFLMLTLSTVLVKPMVATYPFEDIFKKDLLDLADGTPKIESIYIKSWMDTRPSGHLWAFIRINYTAGLSDHEKISVQDYVQRQLESKWYIDIVERNYIYVYCGYLSPPVPWPGFVIGDLCVGFKSVMGGSNVVVSNGFVLETDKAVYACGELVNITFTNYSNETVELGSWPSFEIYDSQGDYVAPTILAFCCPEVSPGESHSWTWDQRTFNSTEVPAGNYTVMLPFRDTVIWTWVTLYLGFEIVEPWIPVAVDTTAPMADAGPDQTVDEDTLVIFDGSASWDNVGIESYTWTFTDVRPRLSGENPTYNFTTPGTYIVTLTVEDAVGNTASDTVTITVLPEVVPEFPTWTSMLLILITLTFATVIYKRRLLKTPVRSPRP